MRRVCIVAIILALAGAAWSVEFAFEERPGELVLLGDGKPWLTTHMAPFDSAKREETYKVYTAVFDFEGATPITKGPGGKYTHHRGLFIGWKNVLVDGKRLNLWEMADTTQRHAEWLEETGGKDRAIQRSKILWCDPNGKTLIEEIRSIAVTPAPGGLRRLDFGSELATHAGPIQLRGDAQHAGMHVRMENEVSEHEASTQYVFPADCGEIVPNDQVKGAWWVCCSPVVREKRYWVLHMTPPDHPTGKPVYSIRNYARFGAFFEPDLESGKPLRLHFRVIVSDHALDQAGCAALYDEYAAARR